MLEYVTLGVAGISLFFLVQKEKKLKKARRRIKKLEEEKQELTALAFFDPLLEIPSSAFMRAELNRRLALLEIMRPPEDTQERRRRAQDRRRQSLAFLYLDMNRFKEINDSHGHDAGDIVLKVVAQALKKRLRRGGVIGRWLSGDEFAILVPNITESNVRILAEKVAHTVRELRVEVKPGVEVHPSIAVGWSHTEEPVDAIAFVRVAEVRMYSHKAGKQ